MSSEIQLDTEISAPRQSAGYHWGWAASLAVVVLLTLFWRHALPIRDGDIWFHMLYGQYFLENHTLIADHTIFSWTPSSNESIYCTWLPDIFLYLMYKAGGLPSLFAFRYICLFSLVWSCFHYACKRKIVSNPLVWFICLIALVMSYTASYVKPEVVSYLFMVLVVWNWWHIRLGSEESWWNCYLFPVVMLVWVNSHGGFVFGAVFLIVVGAGELLNTWLSPQNKLSPMLRKHLMIALMLAAIMPFITPYGYHYPVQLFNDLMPTQDNLSYNSKVAAYISPFVHENPYNLVLSADLAIIILLALFIGNFKKIEWSSLLANLIFAFLYTRFYRTTFYWAPIFMFSSISYLSGKSFFCVGRQFRQYEYRYLPILFVMAGSWLAGDTLYKSVSVPERFMWNGFGISEMNPVAEARYIKKYFPKSRIGNTYDQGAYLLWELWPDNKVFFDARHFPYRNWSENFFNFSAGNNIKEMTTKYPCDLWCIGMQHTRLIFNMLNSGNWQLAFYGKNAVVLLPQDVSLPENGPRISSDFYDLKNKYGASVCFAFACNLKDWQTANKILEAMKITFKGRSGKSTLKWASSYYTGLTSFYAGDYRIAIDSLESLEHRSPYTRYTLTSCYHYLVAESWQKGEIDAAIRYCHKAQKMVPGDIYSAYNLGVFGWWLEQNTYGRSKNSLIVGTNNKGLDWRISLQNFIKDSSSYKEFGVFIETAKAMLGGLQIVTPSLLIPPSPSNQKSSYVGIEDLLPQELPLKAK